MYWKLVTVLLIAVILLVMCYITLDMQKYLRYLPGKEKEKEKDNENPITGKVNVFFQNEDEFINTVKKMKIDKVVYYFPVKCPDYKMEYFLIDTYENLEEDTLSSPSSDKIILEKYYVPEEGSMIIVKKDHKWSKYPDFLYWKYSNEQSIN